MSSVKRTQQLEFISFALSAYCVHISNMNSFGLINDAISAENITLFLLNILNGSSLENINKNKSTEKNIDLRCAIKDYGVQVRTAKKINFTGLLKDKSKNRIYIHLNPLSMRKIKNVPDGIEFINLNGLLKKINETTDKNIESIQNFIISQFKWLNFNFDERSAIIMLPLNTLSFLPKKSYPDTKIRQITNLIETIANLQINERLILSKIIGRLDRSKLIKTIDALSLGSTAKTMNAVNILRSAGMIYFEDDDPNPKLSLTSSLEDFLEIFSDNVPALRTLIENNNFGDLSKFYSHPRAS